MAQYEFVLAKAIDWMEHPKALCAKRDKKFPSNGGFRDETPTLRLRAFSWFQDCAKIRGLEAW
jgi:hypothetical protein